MRSIIWEFTNSTKFNKLKKEIGIILPNKIRFILSNKVEIILLNNANYFAFSITTFILVLDSTILDFIVLNQIFVLAQIPTFAFIQTLKLFIYIFENI